MYAIHRTLSKWEISLPSFVFGETGLELNLSQETFFYSIKQGYFCFSFDLSVLQNRIPLFY